MANHSFTSCMVTKITGHYTFSESDKLMCAQSLRDSADLFTKLASNPSLPPRLAEQFQAQAKDAREIAGVIEHADCLTVHREPTP